MFGASLPPFDFGEGGFWVAVARGAFVAALFSAYGTLLYRLRLAGGVLKRLPAKPGEELATIYERLTIGSLVASLVTACLWLVLEARLLFSSHGASALLHAGFDTLFSTSFGHVLLLQAGSIAASLALLLAARRQATLRDFAMGAIGLAVVLQVGHDHAASMYGGFSILMLSEIAHLLAGAAWLGSLIPLAVTIRTVPGDAARAVAGRYSSFGSACVKVLALTAVYQAWQLVGSTPGLLGTGYGLMVILKIVLFGILLLLALSNRYRLTPRLGGADAAGAARDLVRSIAFETVAAFAILVAAGLLVMLPPSIHEQPLWPFARMFSLVTVSESVDFFSEVILSLFALVFGFSILGAAIYFRRLRLSAALLAAAIAWFAAPHFGLLFVEAYPTSFYLSPTAFAATSIAQGALLYPEHCASCHGPQGRGDGKLAGNLPEPPADLTAEHLWAHSDGELFWWLTNGIKSPQGAQAMPAFGDILSEDERWNLIDYVRANNAGLAYAATGGWPHNLRAPKFQAQCAGGTLTSDDFAGQVVRLVFGNAMPATALSSDVGERLVTILATPAKVALAGNQCLAGDPSLTTAYAAIAGIAPDKLAGTEFLIDTNGWLRAVQKPGQTISWSDPGKLEQQVVQLCAHPLSADQPGHAHHH